MSIVLGSRLVYSTLLLFNVFAKNPAIGGKAYILNPLLLTPYIEKGQIQEGKNLAATNFGGITSFTGYFTVNKNCGNHLFFWFFKAKDDWEKAPLLLWLNGGPGDSSLIGLFQEIGPWRVVGKKLKRNRFSWSKKHNVLFLDQPAGTGFSFSENSCYATNITIVAKEMYFALAQFFTLFPEMRKNNFFLTGESYAGHYIPALAVEIDKRNSVAKQNINLIGIVIGNPYIDPISSYNADFLYELGIIDYKEREIRPIFFDPEAPYDYYNILHNHRKPTPDFTSFLRNDHIKKLIHVGTVDFLDFSETVFISLTNGDYNRSQTSNIEYLLQSQKYIVGFYAGQLDSACPYTSLVKVLRGLDWPGRYDYLRASRSRWYVQDKLAGWVRKTGNLFEIAIRNAGHMVAADQPKVALELITAVVQDLPGTRLLTHLLLDKETQGPYNFMNSTDSIQTRMEDLEKGTKMHYR